MKKIHRAIRPSSIPNEYYLYHVQYTGQGFLIEVVDIIMYYVDGKGVISDISIPDDKIEEAKFAGAAILAADGIVELIDEEEGINGIC
jgi:hypothetical protein